MSRPVVEAVAPGSAAATAGLAVGDEVVSIDGVVPTDVIVWQLLADEADPTLAVRRGGREVDIEVAKPAGVPLGAEFNAAIFDRVQTCDNHCEFCFIYQLPPGLRRSLYLKDDDYRLSFLYGNFTTLTRFTELDLERVLDERLSPLYVSIHATDPDVRSRMLRNRRGAYSLRWLSALLDGGIEVHGQVVVCPGINDGPVLADTLLGVLDRFPALATLAVVPLGVSAHQREPAMRPHTAAEAAAVIDLCEQWQQRYADLLGRRLVYAADEYYLLAGRPFPPAATYGDFPMHEDGIGMARAFEQEFQAGGSPRGESAERSEDGLGQPAPADDLGVTGPGERDGRDRNACEPAPKQRAPAAGFFSWVDGAPAEGYRAVRVPGRGANRSGEINSGSVRENGVPVSLGRRPTDSSAQPADVHGGAGGLAASCSEEAEHSQRQARQGRTIGILTGAYGAAVLEPLVASWCSEVSALAATDGREAPAVRVIEVANDFFGGNIGVTGLLAGADLAAALADEPGGHRYLLADVCLSGGKFIDGMTPAELPRPVEIVPTNGAELRRVLDAAAMVAADGGALG